MTNPKAVVAAIAVCFSTIFSPLVRCDSYSMINDYCPQGCFCPQLEEVWCKNVPFINISYSMWPRLENLTIINANLTTLTSRMFSKYEYLKRLHLENLNTRRVDTNAFAGLPHLQMLRLHGNRIDRLEPYSFSNLIGVREILLNDNDIRSVAKNAFFGSLRLGRLELRNNPVDRIEEGAFNGLSRVDWLRLPSVVQIDAGAFDNLTDVNFVDIRDWRAKETSWNGVPPRTFRGMKNVRTLQIDKSQLGVIRPYAFDGMTNIQFVYIRNSYIDRIRRDSFAGLRKVDQLGLKKNDIDHIDYSALFNNDTAPNGTDRFYDGGTWRVAKNSALADILHFDIAENRLNCSCPNNAWILYGGDVMKTHVVALKNNYCSGSPEHTLHHAALNAKDLFGECEYGYDTDAAVVGARLSSSAVISIFVAIVVRFVY